MDEEEDSASIVPDLSPPVLIRQPSNRRIQATFSFWNSIRPGPGSIHCGTAPADGIEVSRRYSRLMHESEENMKSVCVCLSRSGRERLASGRPLCDTNHLDAFNVWTNVPGNGDVRYISHRGMVWRRDPSSRYPHVTHRHSGEPMIMAWPPSLEMKRTRKYICGRLCTRISRKMVTLISDLCTAEGVAYPRTTKRIDACCPVLVRAPFEHYALDMHQSLLYDDKYSEKKMQKKQGLSKQ